MVPASLPSSQALLNSSGVTAKGAKLVAGLEQKKPKPLASSSGTKFR
jgi:hypothetical protein